jgi:hypothetical protein
MGPGRETPRICKNLSYPSAGTASLPSLCLSDIPLSPLVNKCVVVFSEIKRGLAHWLYLARLQEPDWMQLLGMHPSSSSWKAGCKKSCMCVHMCVHGCQDTGSFLCLLETLEIPGCRPSDDGQVHISVLCLHFLTAHQSVNVYCIFSALGMVIVFLHNVVMRRYWWKNCSISSILIA